MKIWAALTGAGVLAFVPACGGGPALRSFRDRQSGIAFSYPQSWIVVPARGFVGETVSPARLAVMSFRLKGWTIDADCAGSQAIERTPANGAIVIVLADGGDYPPRPRRFTLAGRSLENVECFGPSYRFRFRERREGFQAFVALGRNHDQNALAQALAVLDNLRGS